MCVADGREEHREKTLKLVKINLIIKKMSIQTNEKHRLWQIILFDAFLKNVRLFWTFATNLSGCSSV